MVEHNRGALVVDGIKILRICRFDGCGQGWY